MIDSALDVIRKKLNDYLYRLEPRDDEWVVLSNLFDNEGKLETETERKLAITIFNIEKDNTVATYSRNVPSGNNSYTAVNAPVYINIKFIISANFKTSGYKDGLKAISNTISFFQVNQVFTSENSPEISPQIDKLVLELVNTSDAGSSGLLRAVEAKGLPFVIYKMRMLRFEGAEPLAGTSRPL